MIWLIKYQTDHNNYVYNYYIWIRLYDTAHIICHGRLYDIHIAFYIPNVRRDEQFHVSIVVSIPACHAGDRGSIPRRGAIFFMHKQKFFQINQCE